MCNGWLAGQEARRKKRRFAGGHQRRAEHPRERQHRQKSGDDQQRVDHPRFHVRTLCAFICSSVAMAMTMNRMNATAAAWPMFQNLNPRLYINITTESVALTGPPPV